MLIVILWKDRVAEQRPTESNAAKNFCKHPENKGKTPCLMKLDFFQMERFHYSSTSKFNFWSNVRYMMVPQTACNASFYCFNCSSFVFRSSTRLFLHYMESRWLSGKHTTHWNFYHLRTHVFLRKWKGNSWRKQRWTRIHQADQTPSSPND